MGVAKSLSGFLGVFPPHKSSLHQNLKIPTSTFCEVISVFWVKTDSLILEHRQVFLFFTPKKLPQQIPTISNLRKLLLHHLDNLRETATAEQDFHFCGSDIAAARI